MGRSHSAKLRAITWRVFRRWTKPGYDCWFTQAMAIKHTDNLMLMMPVASLELSPQHSITPGNTSPSAVSEIVYVSAHDVTLSASPASLKIRLSQQTSVSEVGNTVTYSNDEQTNPLQLSSQAVFQHITSPTAQHGSPLSDISRIIISATFCCFLVIFRSVSCCIPRLQYLCGFLKHSPCCSFVAYC